MSSFFKRANRTDTVRYTAPNNEDYIELRAELTKGEVNKVMAKAPLPKKDEHGNDVPNLEGGLSFLETFLDATGVSWSMTDDDGNPVPISVEVYRELDVAAGRWVDDQLSAHLNEVVGKKVAELEGKPKS